MDQCKNCAVRGKIEKCLASRCSQHEGWFVGELMKALVKTGCNDIFCAASDRVCRECPAHLPNTLKEIT